MQEESGHMKTDIEIAQAARMQPIADIAAQAGIPEESIAQVHTPIGTAIQAVTPAEIAVSIAGEMILCRAERRGDKPHGCPMH